MTKAERKEIVKRTQALTEEIANKMMELSILWDTAIDDEELNETVDDALCCRYPFGESFDDLAIDVHFWAESVWKALHNYGENLY